MAFVNLPPNLKDIFYNLSDRISKLEAGPNQAMYTATSAQGTGTQALAEATVALATATQAITSANTAIATANSASAQAIQATFAAGVAQTTADGKNKATYSTSAPSGTGQNGDLWFQVNISGAVINQYVWSAGAYVVAPITNTVISNLDAGKITAGTITGIAYNNGSGTFSVTAAGALVASSATITGHIVATSGTFTGTVNASAGSFTGTVTATSGSFTGTVTATSGSFTGSIYSSVGTIGGFTLSATTLFANSSSSNSIEINSNGSILGGLASQLRMGSIFVNGATGTSGVFLDVTGGIRADGTIAGTTLTSSGAITASGTGTITGVFTAVDAGTVTNTNTPNAWLSTGGILRRSTSSSMRYKENVTDLVNVAELDPKKLLDLPVRAFTYKENYLSNTDDRYQQMFPGFISEEVDAIYPIAADYENGDIESWNDRIIVPAMLALIQDHEARIKSLEGK